jgi:hypothetical protein
MWNNPKTPTGRSTPNPPQGKVNPPTPPKGGLEKVRDLKSRLGDLGVISGENRFKSNIVWDLLIDYRK